MMYLKYCYIFLSFSCFLCLCIHSSEQNALRYLEDNRNELKYQTDSKLRENILKGLRKRRDLMDSLDVFKLLFTGKRDKPKSQKSKSTPKSSVIFNEEYVPNCGRKIVQHTELVSNGLSTKPGDWPWHAALHRTKTSRSQPQYICGGSLLSHTSVLTAGHCVVENNAVILPERLFITLGKYNFVGGDLGSQEKSVFDILLHPEYSGTTLENDIAIVKLSSIVTYTNYVQPICIWTSSNTNKNFIFDRIGTVVGWGFTERDSFSSQLISTTMPVIQDVACIKTNPIFYSRFLTDSTFCAGYRNGSSVCNGDSGGGLYLSEKSDDGQDVWRLRGIVSLSASRKDKNICDPNEYVIFTDAAQYLDFIENNI